MGGDLRSAPGRTNLAPAHLDPLHHAFRAGYAARLAGQPLAACPHGDPVPSLRLAWVRGWLDRLATEPAVTR